MRNLYPCHRLTHRPKSSANGSETGPVSQAPLFTGFDGVAVSIRLQYSNIVA